MNQLKSFRFATFNAALIRNQAGALLADLSTPTHPQAQNVAEIIQRVNPDVLALQEFDYDNNGQALQLFQKNYLHVSQHGTTPIHFDYIYAIPSNTGIPSGMDFDQDGKTDGPGDAFGFGFYPGQYAFAILSKYPIHWNKIRTFQTFLWQDMPAAKLPQNPVTGTPWYSAEQLAIFRLSSKNHIDVPIEFPTGLIHVLIAHPAPPICDGHSNRNSLRNFDEIRLWANYITHGKADYLYDDKGQLGGLAEQAHFVIMGDMNADPLDGESIDQAITQLLRHPRVQSQLIPRSLGGEEHAKLNLDRDNDHRGNPAYHTTNWGLRVDYVLPAKTLMVYGAGIFWPNLVDQLYYLVEKKGEIEASSDHRLVWMDLCLPINAPESQIDADVTDDADNKSWVNY